MEDGVKKALRHAVSATLPVLAAKAVREGKRASRLFVKHLKEVSAEKRKEKEDNEQADTART